MSETTNVENESEVTETTETTEAAEAATTEDAAPAEEAVAEDAAPAEEAAAEDAAPAGDAAAEEEFEAEPTTYRVSTRSEDEVIDGRIEAVTKAKEISVETGQSVLVERTDGRVKMNFRDGSLVDYVLETRKGRRA